jgi:hypothetical protein
MPQFHSISIQFYENKGAVYKLNTSENGTPMKILVKIPKQTPLNRCPLLISFLENSQTTIEDINPRLTQCLKP